MDALTILKPNTSPTETASVQPVRALFWLSCAEDRVTGWVLEILLELVGIAAFIFQISTVIEPL